MIGRIQLILKTKNISPSQFADQIQVQRSGVSHILSGRNNPSLDFILKILKTYPEIDADWLLFGKGQMNTIAVQADNPAKAPSETHKKASGQPDLFAHQEQEPPKPVVQEEKTDIPVIALPEKVSETLKNEIPEKIDKTVKVEKIVVFYDDNTFKEYQPK